MELKGWKRGREVDRDFPWVGFRAKQHGGHPRHLPSLRKRTSFVSCSSLKEGGGHTDSGPTSE